MFDQHGMFLKISMALPGTVQLYVAEDNTEMVEVPFTENPLSPDNIHALEQSIEPMEHCDNHGVSLYLKVQ